MEEKNKDKIYIIECLSKIKDNYSGSLYYFKDSKQAHIKKESLNETNKNNEIIYFIKELDLYEYDKKCIICDNLSTITFNETQDSICIYCFNRLSYSSYKYNNNWGNALKEFKKNYDKNEMKCDK